MGKEDQIILLLTEIRDLLKPKKKKPVERFVPPYQSDVMQYCESNGFKTDPASFVNFYESKNWMIGKNKMKDWKAAIRTWEKKNGQQATTSRAKTHQDKLREIAERDIKQNGDSFRMD